MSSILNGWIENTLYPQIFSMADQAFPEMEFQKVSKGWISSKNLFGHTPQHLKKDKTAILNHAPFCLTSFDNGPKAFIQYIVERDNCSKGEAIKTLAAAVGLRIPQNEENSDYLQKVESQRTILEAANYYFNLYMQQDGEEVHAYLESRGYNGEDIKAMGLGFIPSQERLVKQLVKTHAEAEIREVLGLDKDSRIGKSHQLTIPFRAGGILKGFKFRTISPEVTPKYLNSTGLDKRNAFFNISWLKGNKDLIVVEGDLDALHASIRGIENVVATAGSDITPEQIADAKRRGAKSITLCFDQDKNFENNVLKALRILESELNLKVYVASLPVPEDGSKVDPDSFIKEHDIELFKAVIAKKVTGFKFIQRTIINKYAAVNDGNLNSEQIDSFLEEIIAAGAKIPDALDRDRYRHSFIADEGVRELGITDASLKDTIEKLRYKASQEQQDRDFEELLRNAQQLKGKGATGEALELLSDRSRKIKAHDQEAEFSSLLTPITKTKVKENLSKNPDNIKSGFKIGNDELLFPSGAISILAGPTSHGKTTLLLNSLLNVASEYPEMQCHFFSYEESRENILIKTLNAYIGENISVTAGDNYASIKNYFTKETTAFIKADYREYFQRKEEEFFNNLINSQRLNIHYTAYSSDTLIQAIRFLHENSKPGIIFIDYMQLLHKGSQGKNKYNARHEELKQICIDLKDVAVETGLPIVLGAQFSREVINPLLLHPTNISEAGDIERIANLIIGIWNSNKKMLTKKDSDLKIISEKCKLEKDTLYVEVLKYRDGSTEANGLLKLNGNANKISNNLIQSHIEDGLISVEVDF